MSHPYTKPDSTHEFLKNENVVQVTNFDDGRQILAAKFGLEAVAGSWAGPPCLSSENRKSTLRFSTLVQERRYSNIPPSLVPFHEVFSRWRKNLQARAVRRRKDKEGKT